MDEAAQSKRGARSALRFRILIIQLPSNILAKPLVWNYTLRLAGAMRGKMPYIVGAGVDVNVGEVLRSQMALPRYLHRFGSGGRNAAKGV